LPHQPVCPACRSTCLFGARAMVAKLASQSAKRSAVIAGSPRSKTTKGKAVQLTPDSKSKSVAVAKAVQLTPPKGASKTKVVAAATANVAKKAAQLTPRKRDSKAKSAVASTAKMAKKVAVRTKATKATAPKASPSGKASTNGKMNIDRFFAFCQCSLKMEAQHFMKHDVKLSDKTAIQMWPHVQKMCERNLGKNEKWVPMHTVLGVHEYYVVKEIHHAKVSTWELDPFRRFATMFIFRSHCKRELFEVQLPFLKQEAFWKDPVAAFNRNTPMERAIQDFRAKGNPLQTSCFLIIPERLVPDDDENIIINLLLRTQRLIGLAQDLWPLMNEKKGSPSEKFRIIREKINGVRNLGETWVKMLTVVIDIAKPELRLLQDQCEVGVGASDPLRAILEAEGLLPPKEKKDAGVKRPGIDTYALYPSIKWGVVCVKKMNRQLVQVTKSRAGTLDRAHMIAEKLCKAANSGKTLEEVLALKVSLMNAKGLKVPKLGLDEKQAELLAAEAAKKESQQVDGGSGSPSPMQALAKLRDRITSSTSASSRNFQKVLCEVESKGRAHFKSLPLVAKQMKSASQGLSCATLQVQLCEFRQFENSLKQAAHKRGASEMQDC